MAVGQREAVAVGETVGESEREAACEGVLERVCTAADGDKSADVDASGYGVAEPPLGDRVGDAELDGKVECEAAGVALAQSEGEGEALGVCVLFAELLNVGEALALPVAVAVAEGVPLP